jgi:ABC-type branched-subunit amino acid transport system ATPase component
VLDRPPVLECIQISVRFGGHDALDSVDLTLGPGSIAGLIGPNGSGKTTLFNVVSGLLAPRAGRVALGGVDVTMWPPHRRARAGLARTFQCLELFDGLTVFDNLLAVWEASAPGRVMAFRRHDGRRRVTDVITQLGLEGIADRLAGQLSTGQGRMVELARALSGSPRVLLLDEPGAGLDDREVASLEDTLRRVVGSGPDAPAILLVEHDMRLLMDVCERITVLEFGSRIAEGTPEEIEGDDRVAAAYLGSAHE